MTPDAIQSLSLVGVLGIAVATLWPLILRHMRAQEARVAALETRETALETEVRDGYDLRLAEMRAAGALAERVTDALDATTEALQTIARRRCAQLEEDHVA